MRPEVLLDGHLPEHPQGIRWRGIDSEALATAKANVDNGVVSANVLSPEEILAGMDAMSEKYTAQGGKLYSTAQE